MKISLDKIEGIDELGLFFGERIFSVMCDGELVIFREECDGWYTEEMSKEQAVGYLEAVIEYIKTGKLILKDIGENY